MEAASPRGVVQLSETERFSCSAIYAVALHQLYPESYDEAFCKASIEGILEYFSQPDQVKRICRSYVSGEAEHTMLPFAQTLLESEKWMSMADVIRHFLLASLCGGIYDARTRVLLKHLCLPLRVSWEHFEELEEHVVGLLEDQMKNKDATDEGARRASSRKKKRFAMIGLAAVGGGALIGLTGGLAAPLVAAGAGVLIGGSAAAIGTVTGAAVLGSVFGVAGAGLTGFKMRKRVGTVKEFEFVPMAATKQLSVTIAISGWIQSDTNDFFLPWKTLDISKEQYYLRWESRELKEMGQALDYLLGAVKTLAIQETLKLTVLSGILTAIAWPAALVSAASFIDNPWSVCLSRAEEAGRVLADLLVSREQGSRPVTLIGFSVGARVIFYCLQELAKRKNDTQGIVEDVYLLGAPVSSNPKDWKAFSRVVSGKFVNCYSKSDWVLKFLFRTATASMSIAGLEAVDLKDRRMCNIDLTSIVNGHKEYFRQMDEILRVIGVRTKKPMTRATSLQMAVGQAAPLKPTSFSASATFCATPEVAAAEVEALTDCLAKAEISSADQPKKPEKPTSTSSAPVEMFREETDFEFLEEVEKMEEAVETAKEAKEADEEEEEEEELQMEEISATTSAVPASSEVLFQRRFSRPDPSRCSVAASRRRRRLTR